MTWRALSTNKYFMSTNTSLNAATLATQSTICDSTTQSPRNLLTIDKCVGAILSVELASPNPTMAEWMQDTRAGQPSALLSPCTPATDHPSPGTIVPPNGLPEPSSPHILKYATGRFHAALDHFHDVLFHVLAHVASFHPEAFSIIGRNYQVDKNIVALRDLMALQGFTKAVTTPSPVLDEYAFMNQMQARVALNLRHSPAELKILELEDCIFLMRKSAANLNAAMVRVFPNFCPILERPRVTPGEGKCAIKPIRKRTKGRARKSSARKSNQPYPKI